jgi:GGDEF domain-containing protein
VSTYGYQLSCVGVSGGSLAAEDPVLLCDPLTMLVAYPSFEEHLTRVLPRVANAGLHLAIGDVDGLREYVTERRSADPASFGHLAGNDCMRRIGALTGEWARTHLAVGWTFRICGTFGGDEVIVSAVGLPHERFVEAIALLCQQIRASAPRPCSFALGTLVAREVTEYQAPGAYRTFVSQIDASLFDAKEEWRAGGGLLNGRVLDVGHISV